MTHQDGADGWRKVQAPVTPMLDGMSALSETIVQSAATGLLQRTLKAPIHCSGVGLHSGATINMTLTPAEPNTGIVFRRIDLKNGARDIRARFDAVTDTRLCTTISNGHNGSVATVEHLMAALAGCGVDNAIVELDGPEVPVMDGSSEPFVFLIDCAGIVEQAAERTVVRVKRPVRIDRGEAFASLEPGRRFTMAMGIDFDSQAIGRQDIFLEISDLTFKRELSQARTFGFLHEVEAMRAAGLARGGSLDNAVVIDGDKIVNEDGLRYEDEFVRHKALDCVGDLALAGGPILGHFKGRRTGHELNNKLLRALFADEENFDLVPSSELLGF